jgi:hypothetical protein
VALRRADHSSKESYRLCKNDYETEEEARAQQRAVEPFTNELNVESNCSVGTINFSYAIVSFLLRTHKRRQLSDTRVTIISPRHNLDG